jgi:hypothetical protein
MKAILSSDQHQKLERVDGGELGGRAGIAQGVFGVNFS